MRINQLVSFEVSEAELDFIQEDFNQRLGKLLNEDGCVVQKRKASNVAAILATFEQVREDQIAQLCLVEYNNSLNAFLVRVQVISSDGQYYDSDKDIWIGLSMNSSEIQDFLSGLNNHVIPLDLFVDLSTDHLYQVKKAVVLEVKRIWAGYIGKIGKRLGADSLNAEFVISNNDPCIPEYFVCYPSNDSDYPGTFHCMAYDWTANALVIVDEEYQDAEDVADSLRKWYENANI